jgi:hypothetical protein
MTLSDLLNKQKQGYRCSNATTGVEVIFKDGTSYWITEYDYWELRQLQLGEAFQSADTTRKELKEKYGINLNH